MEQAIKKDPKQAAKEAKLSDTLKSLDTEEHIDLWFYRPMGFWWAKLAARCGVTPNAITIASIFLGIGAAVCFYFTNVWVNICGMILLMWANTFDSADGQLARMTGQYSRIGRILDGMAGDVWFISIYIAFCLRQVEPQVSIFFAEHVWLIWVMAACSGACHATQASMADLYRQVHLFFLKGEDGSELEDYTTLKEQYKKISWKSNFFKKLTMTLYLNYNRQQVAMTPQMQRMRRALKERFGDGPLPQQFRDDFRTMSLPLMKYTNILSFNWRVTAMFVAVFIGQPWLYFAVEMTLFNSLLIYMVRRHESICRTMTKRLEEGVYGGK